jgi:uncharacterized protein
MNPFTKPANDLRRWVMRLLWVMVLVYLSICLLLYAYQRSLLYFPQSRSVVAGVDVMSLPVSGANIEISMAGPIDGHAIVYFGGNADDVSVSVGGLRQQFPNHAIYAMHYRGYGGSTGKASEKAIIGDAFALMDHVESKHQNISLIGRSLGSGVAVQVAAVRPIAKLILVTPYDSIANIAAQLYPWLPIRLLLQDKFESWKFAQNITAPSVIIAADVDDIIPRRNTMALYDAFPKGSVHMHVVAKTDHNSIVHCPEYWRLLAQAL